MVQSKKEHIHPRSEITDDYDQNQDPLVKQKHLAITAGMIPLYAGSTVYVYKADLLKIFHENPKVYTGRLANLLFGSETLRKCSEYKELDRFSYLDTDFLSALISKFAPLIIQCAHSFLFSAHTVALYTSRKINITVDDVKEFLHKKLNKIKK